MQFNFKFKSPKNNIKTFSINVKDSDYIMPIIRKILNEHENDGFGTRTRVSYICINGTKHKRNKITENMTIREFIKKFGLTVTQAGLDTYGDGVIFETYLEPYVYPVIWDNGGRDRHGWNDNHYDAYLHVAVTSGRTENGKTLFISNDAYRISFNSDTTMLLLANKLAKEFNSRHPQELHVRPEITFVSGPGRENNCAMPGKNPDGGPIKKGQSDRILFVDVLDDRGYAPGVVRGLTVKMGHASKGMRFEVPVHVRGQVRGENTVSWVQASVTVECGVTDTLGDVIKSAKITGLSRMLEKLWSDTGDRRAWVASKRYWNAPDEIESEVWRWCARRLAANDVTNVMYGACRPLRRGHVQLEEPFVDHWLEHCGHNIIGSHGERAFQLAIELGHVSLHEAVNTVTELYNG